MTVTIFKYNCSISDRAIVNAVIYNLLAWLVCNFHSIHWRGGRGEEGKRRGVDKMVFLLPEGAFCLRGVLAREGFLQEGEFWPEGFFAGGGFCQEGVLVGGGFVLFPNIRKCKVRFRIFTKKYQKFTFNQGYS